MLMTKTKAGPLWQSGMKYEIKVMGMMFIGSKQTPLILAVRDQMVGHDHILGSTSGNNTASSQDPETEDAPESNKVSKASTPNHEGLND